MKKVLTVVVAAMCVSATLPLGASSGDPFTLRSLGEEGSGERVAAGTVKVTVNYKGKGKVDATHKLWVWIFDTPNIGAGTMPVDQLALDANGADAVFNNVAPGEVWIAVAFDESGVMTGNEPPPSGSPISVYMAGGAGPTPVTPGEKAIVTLTFDDSMRMP